MNKLKEILLDPSEMWWEADPNDPVTKGWRFSFYCESYMEQGETIDDAMQCQSYRVVATHKTDGRTRSVHSKTSFDAAYHTVLTMLMVDE